MDERETVKRQFAKTHEEAVAAAAGPATSGTARQP